jgi:hypothetical protein
LGKDFILCGSHRKHISLSILHSFGHQCYYCLSAAYVPDAIGKEVIENLMGRLFSPRAPPATTMTPVQYRRYWGREIMTFNALLEQRAVVESLRVLLRDLANYRTRLHTYCTHFHALHNSEAPEPIPSDWTAPETVLGQLDVLLRKLEIAAQGADGGFRRPQAHGALFLKKRIQLEKEKAHLAHIAQLLQKVPEMDYPEKREGEGAADGTQGSAPGTRGAVKTLKAAQLPPAHIFLLTVAASSVLPTSFKKAFAEADRTPTAVHSVFLRLQANFNKRSMDVPTFGDTPEATVRHAVHVIVTSFYTRQHFLQRLASKRWTSSELDKDNCKKQASAAAKHVQQALDVFNSIWELVPMGSKLAAGGSWVNVPAPQVKQLKDWVEGDLPEHLLPNNMLPANYEQQGMRQLLYDRAMVARAREAVQRAMGDIQCLVSNLEKKRLALRRKLEVVAHAVEGPYVGAELGGAISSALRVAGLNKEEGLVQQQLLVPNQGCRNLLTSLLEEEVQSNESQLLCAKRALVASHELVGEFVGDPKRWYLPCEHKLAMLLSKVSPILKGEVSMSAVLGVAKAPCKKCAGAEGEGAMEEEEKDLNAEGLREDEEEEEEEEGRMGGEDNGEEDSGTEFSEEENEEVGEEDSEEEE